MGDEALVGRVLDDRYLIGERIARGGMASVFRATDRRLDREVAVKVMHNGLGDAGQFTDRFKREAKSAAKLNHRNVVSVFDQGSDGEITYLVMEYVPGRTLRDVMRDESPMSPHRALELIEQVLVALAAAHAAHIIHRDVKPENVLITPDGEVKVADFGLARAVSAATTATGGTLIGTVSYLAPEIVVNEGADARSDVYAVGAMLYEMLTGLKPHSGESPIQVAYKHVHEDIGAPSQIQAGIPPYIDALVARATARDRDQRSADAHVLLQQVRLVQRALAAGLDDDPDLTTDLTPAPERGEPRRPSAMPASLAAAAAAAATDPDATQLVGDPDRTQAVPVLAGAGAAGTVEGVAEAPEHTIAWSPDAPNPVPSGLHPAMDPQQFKAMKKSEPGKRQGRLLLIVALVLALMAAALGYYIGIGRYVEAPVLVGLSESQAIAEAESGGFTLKVAERKFSETAPLGTVMSTDPDAGNRILPGGTIEAVISKGKERYEIPELKGKTPEEAKTILTELNLELGETSEKFDEKVEKGKVIGPDGFKVGDKVKRDTVVNLFISKGREPIDVVDYTGKTQAEATKGLEDAGFKVEVKKVFHDSVKKDVVVSQDPYEGTKFKDDTITITVSNGPQLFEVPKVTGKSKNQATDILQKAGFKVSSAFPGSWSVNCQSPGAGAKHPKGTTVTITPLPTC